METQIQVLLNELRILNQQLFIQTAFENGDLTQNAHRELMLATEKALFGEDDRFKIYRD